MNHQLCSQTDTRKWWFGRFESHDNLAVAGLVERLFRRECLGLMWKLRGNELFLVSQNLRNFSLERDLRKSPNPKYLDVLDRIFWNQFRDSTDILRTDILGADILRIFCADILESGYVDHISSTKSFVSLSYMRKLADTIDLTLFRHWDLSVWHIEHILLKFPCEGFNPLMLRTVSQHKIDGDWLVRLLETWMFGRISKRASSFGIAVNPETLLRVSAGYLSCLRVGQGVDFHPYPLFTEESKMKCDRKFTHFGVFSVFLEQKK